jgi:hypothetical protein
MRPNAIFEFQHTQIIVPGKPLGRLRLVNWRAFVPEIKPAHALPEIHTAVWRENVEAPLDQGEVGACTGFAAGGCANTRPFDGQLSNDECLRIYKLATEIDPFPGSWPTVDTGSSGYAGFDAATRLGHFSGFAMADGEYSLTAALSCLMTRPIGLGLPWFEGFDSPAPNGQIRPTGRIRGGHEIKATGIKVVLTSACYPDSDRSRVWLRNSWGDWGVELDGLTGYCWISWSDLSALLNSDGDCTAPDLPAKGPDK